MQQLSRMRVGMPATLRLSYPGLFSDLDLLERRGSCERASGLLQRAPVGHNFIVNNKPCSFSAVALPSPHLLSSREPRKLCSTAGRQLAAAAAAISVMRSSR
jgi:hypothetical protein